MTPALQGAGGDRMRAEAKRPPGGGAVGRCRCWRTGGGVFPLSHFQECPA